MYRDDDMSPGFFAPYQVRLDNGDLVLAPADSDDAIRSLKRKAEAMQTFHPLASVTVAGCHFTRSKWGCETLAYPSNLRSKDTQP